MFCQQKSCNSTRERLATLGFSSWKNGNWVAFGRKTLNGVFNGCLLLGMRAAAWLPWGGTCQHLMAPRVALPDLEGWPQHGREYAATVSPLAPTFLSRPPALLFTSGVTLWRRGPAVSWLALLTARAPPLKPRLQVSAPAVGAETAPAEHLSLRSGCPTPVGLLWLYLPEVENSWKRLWDLVWGCPRQLSLGIRNRRRLKVLLLWLSWSQGETSAAVWWLRLTCLLLLSVRALNHFVLFHPITWIHFKLWNSPFLPWLICEICHLPSWFALCPS